MSQRRIAEPAPRGSRALALALALATGPYIHATPARPALVPVPVKFYDYTHLPEPQKDQVHDACKIAIDLLQRTTWVGNLREFPLDVAFYDPDDAAVVGAFGGPAGSEYLVVVENGAPKILLFWSNFPVARDTIPLEIAKIIFGVFKSWVLNVAHPGYPEADVEFEALDAMIRAFREIRAQPDFPRFKIELKAALSREIFVLGKRALRLAFSDGVYARSCGDVLKRIGN